MNSRQLHVFVQIAEAENLRRAASRLRIAQPALSRYVRALEDELGVKLLDRHPHGVSVTPAGAYLLERGRAILNDIEETRAEIMATGDRLTGRVTVATSTSMSKLLFAGLTRQARDNFPDIALELREGGFYQLLEGLDTRRINLAVMADAEPRSNLAIEPVALDSLCVFGPRDDNRIGDGEIEMAELAAMPLAVVRRPSGPRMTLERAAARASVTLDIAYELDNPDVIKDFVDHRLACGILPRCSVLADATSGRFRIAPLRGVPLVRQLVRRADQPASPAVDAVVAAVRAEFARLTDEGVFARLS